MFGRRPEGIVLMNMVPQGPRKDVLWISENGKWRISIEDYGTMRRLVISDGWTVDRPVMYADGTVAYDDPYAVPHYVKNVAEGILRKMRME